MPPEVREALREQWGNAVKAIESPSDNAWSGFDDWWNSKWNQDFRKIIVGIGGGAFALIKAVFWDSWTGGFAY